MHNRCPAFIDYYKFYEWRFYEDEKKGTKART